MSLHKDEVRYRHMLDHALEALAMVQGKNRSDLDNDRMLELSLVRLVEIIGEAAGRVGTESREKYPSIRFSTSATGATPVFSMGLLNISFKIKHLFFRHGAI